MTNKELNELEEKLNKEEKGGHPYSYISVEIARKLLEEVKRLKKKKTIKRRILDHLAFESLGYYSAWEIAKSIHELPSSVSARLCEMRQRNEVLWAINDKGTIVYRSK